jgi:xanthine dehydrogenase YagS FAD-binding subunit
VRPFTFVEPATVQEAVGLLREGRGAARPIAGGSDLLGELKEGTVAYDRLVSLAGLPGLAAIEETECAATIGAMATVEALVAHRFGNPSYTILNEAAQGVATPEIRTVATVGGNLCQRPRCWYYRNALFRCLKKGGTDCPAVEGFNKYLAILGAHRCYIVHPSDLAPPLVALDASVRILGPAGARWLPLAEFFVGPERDPLRESVLAADEIVSEVRILAPPAGWRGTYVKARERTAGDFPMVSVAAGFALEGGAARHARIVLGAVAPVPWRAPAAEAVLEGQPVTPERAAQAAEAALAGAQPMSGNAYKLDVARALIARTILTLAAPPK